jgi:hypothetical protein
MRLLAEELVVAVPDGLETGELEVPRRPGELAGKAATEAIDGHAKLTEVDPRMGDGKGRALFALLQATGLRLLRGGLLSLRAKGAAKVLEEGGLAAAADAAEDHDAGLSRRGRWSIDFEHFADGGEEVLTVDEMLEPQAFALQPLLGTPIRL